MLVNHTNLHDRHKVFQVAHKSRGCKQSIRITVFFFNFHRSRQKGRRNLVSPWIIKISMITRPYKLCTQLKTKAGTVLSGEITWLPFLSLFVKVFIQSSIMVHVLSPNFIG